MTKRNGAEQFRDSNGGNGRNDENRRNAIRMKDVQYAQSTYAVSVNDPHLRRSHITRNCSIVSRVSLEPSVTKGRGWVQQPKLLIISSPGGSLEIFGIAPGQTPNVAQVEVRHVQ